MAKKKKQTDEGGTREQILEEWGHEVSELWGEYLSLKSDPEGNLPQLVDLQTRILVKVLLHLGVMRYQYLSYLQAINQYVSMIPAIPPPHDCEAHRLKPLLRSILSSVGGSGLEWDR